MPNSAVYYGGNGLGWSLSTEAFFYILFPLLLSPLARLSRRSTVQVLAAATATAILVPVALHPAVENDGFSFWAIYINPSVRLLEFIAGMCLAGLLRDGLRLGVRPGAAMLLVLAAYLAVDPLPLYLSWVAVTIVPFALLIFACAEADLEGRATGLKSRALQRLGQLSFAFYLTHYLVLRCTIRIVGTEKDIALRIAAASIALLVAVGCAYALFRWVEHPMEERLRPRSRT